MAKALNIKNWMVAGAAAVAAYLCIHRRKIKGTSGIGATDWYHALYKADMLGIDFSIPYHQNRQDALYALEKLGKKIGYRNSTEIPYGRAFFYALQKKRKNFLNF